MSSTYDSNKDRHAMTGNGVITLAINEPYLELASNLAASFLCFHSTKDIGFTIITNNDFALSSALERGGIRILVSDQLSHEGRDVLLNKPIAAQLSPYDNTIMLDSDCLLSGSLAPLFDMLNGADLSVVGEKIDEGEWHLDVPAVLKRFEMPFLYRFVGSFYYFTNKVEVARVFREALALTKACDAMGVTLVHGRLVNEEVPMSLAMVLQTDALDIRILPETLPIKMESMFYLERYVNILSGRSRMCADSKMLRAEFFQGIWPLEKSAVIVAYDSGSRHQIDYRLNALQARILAKVVVLERPNLAQRLLAIFRLGGLAALLVTTDVCNIGLNWKRSLGSFFRRIF